MPTCSSYQHWVPSVPKDPVLIVTFPTYLPSTAYLFFSYNFPSYALILILLIYDLISRLDGDVSFDFDVDVDDVDVGEFVTNPIPMLVGIGGARERFGKTKLALDHLVSRLIEWRKKLMIRVEEWRKGPFK